MKYEDFKVETFNKGEVVRVTHKESGVTRESDDTTKEGVILLMQDIRDEIREKKRPCSFATAMGAVVNEGKGMHIVGDPHNVVRAQWPDDFSMMDLPYLYMTSPDVGMHPWSIESCAPFATWLIID